MIHVVSLLFASKSCKQVTGNAKGNGGIAHPLHHYSVCGSVREINNWSSYRRWSRTTDRLRWLPAAAAHHRTNTVVPSFLLLCIMMRRPSDRPTDRLPAIKKRWEMQLKPSSSTAHLITLPTYSSRKEKWHQTVINSLANSIWWVRRTSTNTSKPLVG